MKFCVHCQKRPLTYHAPSLYFLPLSLFRPQINFYSCSTYLLFSGLELPRVGSVLLFVIMQMSSFILPVIKASTPPPPPHPTPPSCDHLDVGRNNYIPHDDFDGFERETMLTTMAMRVVTVSRFRCSA